MRDIAIDLKVGQLPTNTFVIYGDTRTGKTEFGATLPRPLILADVTEGGYSTISNMDRSKWFEEDMPPIIKGIENMNDIATITPWLRGEIARKRIMSVVFDAFSFYVDFYLAQMTKSWQAAGKEIDNRRIYGNLGIHLREVRTNLHSLGCNIVWNCLAKHPDTDDPKGKPMISGQQADKFAAGVDFLFHSRIDKVRPEGAEANAPLVDQYELRTRQFGKYIAGNRLGVKASNLPDPFVGTYADLLYWLGYDLEAVYAAMPKVLAAPPAAPAQPAAKGTPAPAAKAPPVVVRPGSPSAASAPASNNQAPRGAVKQ